jgi:inosine-uridine nucleoside N-ribohydrolase
LIYDDDGSPDGTLANLYLLAHPDVDLKVVSISYGEATPKIYIQHIGRMLDELGFTNILLGYGQDAPIAGTNSFPEGITEAANTFWYTPIPNPYKTYPAKPAAERIISVINQSPEPVTLYFAGAYTTLAQALELDPSIVDNIHALYLMGGAVFVPGNIHDFYPEDENVYAEWNLYADPQAAKEVFAADLDIYLIPLDATNQVLISRQDTNAWRRGGAIGNFAADFYESIMMATNDEAAIWDLLAAIAMLEPELCPFVPLHLEVITEDGPHSGHTAPVPDGEPNIHVCLEPDAELVRQHIIDIFTASR